MMNAVRGGWAVDVVRVDAELDGIALVGTLGFRGGFIPGATSGSLPETLGRTLAAKDNLGWIGPARIMALRMAL